MMTATVYILCMITALVCAALLLRGYRQSNARLLLWSGICFGLFAIDNLLLFVDAVIVPDVDLMTLRSPAALIGVVLLLYGLIWENR